MTFRIHALPLAPFRPLFDLDDAALRAMGACRMIADAPHAERDAAVGRWLDALARTPKLKRLD